MSAAPPGEGPTPATGSPAGPPGRRRIEPVSIALVAAQFLLIAILASPIATLVPSGPVGALGALCLAGSLALVGWAFASMRPANFSVLPEPVDGNRLVTRGPYARVRHPMYSAVLLGGLGACLLHGTATDWLLLVALAAVMVVKARREERLLRAVHPGYAGYASRTSALVPGVY